MKTLLYSMLLGIAALIAVPVLGQGQSTDVTNMQILRDKLKADKKLVVAANMQLTDAEAAKFWPIYDAYQNDLQAINLRLGNAILEYAEAYKKNTLTDDEARKLADEALAIEDTEAKMRHTYFAKMQQAIAAKKAARYLQIESKIRAAVRYEMAASIPLLQ